MKNKIQNKNNKNEYTVKFYVGYVIHNEWDENHRVIEEKYFVIDNYNNTKYDSFRERKQFKIFHKRMNKKYSEDYGKRLIFGKENI